MSDNQDVPKLSPLELMRVAGMPEIVRLTGLDVKAHSTDSAEAPTQVDGRAPSSRVGNRQATNRAHGLKKKASSPCGRPRNGT